MKLQQLVEADDASLQQIKQFGQQVKQDCSLFLNNKSPNVNLYRGRHDRKPLVIDRQISGKRVPFTEYEVVEYLHQYMTQSGFKATRLNGYYTAPSPQHASDFGVGVYAVFPVGDYALTWHRTNELPPDLGGDAIIDFVKDFAADSPDHDVDELDSQDIVELFWEMYGDQFMQGHKVNPAAKQGSEVIVLTDKVHMIRRDLLEHHQQILNQIWYGE